MSKFKGMEIMHTINDNIIVCYAQFDLGAKYKIYKKVDGYYQYVYSENSITKAIDYAGKIFIGV